MQARNADPLIERLAAGLRALQVEQPLMVGVLTGGVWIAERLHQMLHIEEPLGSLSINFYRDDFTRIGLHPRVLPSDLPFDVNDRNIILIDDVLHTGRTIRAALNEIFDYGRPANVSLGVLVDRQGRELPISPDVTAETISLADNEHIKLTGPNPLNLVVQKVQSN
jgi:pyrimidine operon attenuation protein/uracil phosphoribosyltransferase